MAKQSYRFFCNKKCEYFPCHKAENTDEFNCLFCYCPLFALGDKCGGNFTWTKGGHKDCSACMLPHTVDGYDYIIGRYGDILTVAIENSSLPNSGEK